VKKIQSQLPGGEEYRFPFWREWKDNLAILFDSFVNELEKRKDYIAFLQSLVEDPTVCIVQPVKPTIYYSQWKILLDRSRDLAISVAMPFNVYEKEMQPILAIEGKIEAKKYLEERLSSYEWYGSRCKCLSSRLYYRKWHLSFYDNLLRLTEMTNLPSKMDQIEFSDCGICFCRDCHGQVPSISCENSTCRQIYHKFCIEEVNFPGFFISRLLNVHT
jgi:hypothetical protein